MMDKEALLAKMSSMQGPCTCGSGKPAWQCCKQGEAMAIGNEMCPCGSGKMVKDCCMKSPETHQNM